MFGRLFCFLGRSNKPWSQLWRVQAQGPQGMRGERLVRLQVVHLGYGGRAVHLGGECEYH